MLGNSRSNYLMVFIYDQICITKTQLVEILYTWRVVKSGSKSKWWHEGYVDNLSDTQILLGVKQSNKGLSTLGSSTRETAMSAGKAWVGDNYNIIKDGAGNVLGYSSADGMRAFRIQYKPKEGMWRANFQENIMVNNPYPNPGQHSSQLKNVHIDILD